MVRKHEGEPAPDLSFERDFRDLAQELRDVITGWEMVNPTPELLAAFANIPESDEAKLSAYAQWAEMGMSAIAEEFPQAGTEHVEQNSVEYKMRNFGFALLTLIYLLRMELFSQARTEVDELYQVKDPDLPDVSGILRDIKEQLGE